MDRKRGGTKRGRKNITVSGGEEDEWINAPIILHEGFHEPPSLSLLDRDECTEDVSWRDALESFYVLSRAQDLETTFEDMQDAIEALVEDAHDFTKAFDALKLHQ